LPRTSSQIDWEAEIGVVIGRAAHDVSLDQAMNCVAGYTIVNDLSARDLNRREDWTFGTDWFRGKSFDGSAPMGPWITPAEAIPDPHNLVIQLCVNDQLMQDSSSRQMHFNIPEQIQYLSEQLTLRPGDVISTGTPAGVGRPRGIYLKPGDEVTITIEGLGTLRNRVERA
jgi:2,4-diketo-3-deoxy-L-fuconate hydrolase